MFSSVAATSRGSQLAIRGWMYLFDVNGDSLISVVELGVSLGDLQHI
jgi:hypothetical protein